MFLGSIIEAFFICSDYHQKWGSHQMSLQILLSQKYQNLFGSIESGFLADRKVRNFWGFSKSLQALLVI